MDIAKWIGRSERVAIYEVPDTELAVGSTLGGPKVAAIIKASGAIEKVFSTDTGETLFGTVTIRHYDATTGMYLAQEPPGKFIIHPEHQEHVYSLSNRVEVHEDIFVLNSQPQEDGTVDPPAIYQTVELRNGNEEPVERVTYAHAILRGDTEHDVEATYDKRLGVLIVSNKSRPELGRVFGCSVQACGFETTPDVGR